MNRTAAALVALAVLTAVAAAGLWRLTTADPPAPVAAPDPVGAAAPDPRVTYAGPYRNVRPDVRYVGSGQCALCHVEIADTFSRHPMGRSLTPAAEFVRDMPPTDAPHGNPFTAFGSTFTVERDGDRLWQREVRRDEDGREVYRADTEAHYAIGSGSHGHSFLTVRDGFVLQTPVSWYSQKGTWDASPGFADAMQPGRPVDAGCLSCHVDRAHPTPGSVNHNEPPVFTGDAIGCERCHGPGELHVAAMNRAEVVKGVDLTVVNPARLPPPLREAVCQQCHLKGEARVPRRGRGAWDFRPGLPLEEVTRVFVRPGGPDGGLKSVGHVEQMYSSACFRKSEGRLGCVSCHDPHALPAPEARVGWYRRKCMECHEKRGCSLPADERLARRPDDSCAACHMPPSPAKDIVHAALTDHRVPRRPEVARPDAPPGAAVPFHGGRPEADPELARDLALARVDGMRSAAPSPGSWQTLSLLEQAVTRDPKDVPAWTAKGALLLAQGRADESLAAFEAAVRVAPRDEAALHGAAEAAGAAGRLDAAADYRRRSVAANPLNAHYRERLTRLLVLQRAWDEAGPAAEAWLAVQPSSPDARAVRAEWLARSGRHDDARAELGRLAALRPPDLEAVRRRVGAFLK